MIKLPDFCGIGPTVEILIAKENTNSHIINKPSFRYTNYIMYPPSIYVGFILI